MQNFLIAVAFAVSVSLLTGCTSNVKLGGKVTFSDDGSPLTVGQVCFEKDNSIARSEIKPDGTYQLSSISEGDGLPPGKYKIYIVSAELVTTGSDGNSTYTPLVAEKQTTAASTNIELEVTSSTHTFDFQVDRAPKKK